MLGAIFAALDTAIAAIGEARLHAIADEAKGAVGATARRVLDRRTALSARLLTGRVLCVGAAAGLGAQLAVRTAGWVGAMLAGAAVALLYGLVAEVLGTVARRRRSRAVLRALRLIRPLELLFAPIAWPLVQVAALTERIVPTPADQDAERMTELVVEHVIEQGEESGSIPSDHAELLRSVLEFRNTVAREVMVPRTQMVAVDIDTPIDEVLRLIVDEGHSRYPVYRERLDQIEGVLNAKDLFQMMRDGRTAHVALAQLVRKPVFFANETQKIGNLLNEMQARRAHLAVVVDEFGGTSGIVTLEDILEEMVGEIRDEHDEEEASIHQLGPGRYVADAGVSVYDIEEVIGEELHEANGDYDSLGGMVIALAGRVPSPGESVAAGSFDLVVRGADERHVTRVEIVKRHTDQPNAAE